VGWADPNKWVSFSPKKRLGRPRPNQKFLFSLGQARPRRARLGQHRAGPATEAQRGENYFLLPAFCMQNNSACRRRRLQQKKMQEGRKCTWRGGGGRWWCCGGGRWRCRGSRTATPGGAAAVYSGSVRSLGSLLFRFLSFLPVSSFLLPLSFGFSVALLCSVVSLSSSLSLVIFFLPSRSSLRVLSSLSPDFLLCCVGCYL